MQLYVESEIDRVKKCEVGALVKKIAFCFPHCNDHLKKVAVRKTFAFLLS